MTSLPLPGTCLASPTSIWLNEPSKSRIASLRTSTCSLKRSVTECGDVETLVFGPGVVPSRTAWADAALAVATRTTAAMAGTANSRRRRYEPILITSTFRFLRPSWMASGRCLPRSSEQRPVAARPLVVAAGTGQEPDGGEPGDVGAVRQQVPGYRPPGPDVPEAAPHEAGHEHAEDREHGAGSL